MTEAVGPIDFPSTHDILTVHIPTILLTAVAMMVFLFILGTGVECAERLYKRYMEQYQQQPADEMDMDDYQQPPPYTNRPTSSNYEQATNVHIMSEDGQIPRRARTRTTSTNTRATKCHKTTNTDDAVSALIAAGNRWAEDNKIKG